MTLQFKTVLNGKHFQWINLLQIFQEGNAVRAGNC
jgi:hypothetical protein